MNNYDCAGMTLEEAKEWLRERLEEGASCPCCTQLAKVYKRPITSTMARHLINLYFLAIAHEGRNQNKNWYHTKDITTGQDGSGDWAKLKNWELIEEKPLAGDEFSKSSGYWRITEKGIAFVLRDLAVQKYARIYDGRLLGFDGEEVNIAEALGTKFDYEKLMADCL